MRMPISHGTDVSGGITKAHAAPTTSETLSGRAAPKRSERRPASGDRPDSTSAPHRNVDGDHQAGHSEPGQAQRREHVSMPKAIPARAISQLPIMTCRSRRAGSAARSGCGTCGARRRNGERDHDEEHVGDRGGRERGPSAHDVGRPPRPPGRTARRPPPRRSRCRAARRAVPRERPWPARTVRPSRCRRRRAPARSAPRRAGRERWTSRRRASTRPSASARAPPRPGRRAVATSAPLGSDPSSVPAG